MKKRYKYKYEFESISNELEAYALGLFYTDGSVGIRKYYNGVQSAACLHLQPSDKAVLIKINDYISEDTTTSCTEAVCMIRYYNAALTKNLIALGCKQNKTYNGIDLAELPEALNRHLIRGIFDGDGSLVIDRSQQRINPKSSVWPKAYIASTDLTFIEEIQKILSLNNIYSSINIDRRVGKTLKTPSGYNSNCVDLYRLYIRRKADLKRFYHYLYDDATIFIERKKDKFIEYVNTEISIETKESIPS